MCLGVISYTYPPVLVVVIEPPPISPKAFFGHFGPLRWCYPSKRVGFSPLSGDLSPVGVALSPMNGAGISPLRPMKGEDQPFEGG